MSKTPLPREMEPANRETESAISAEEKLRDRDHIDTPGSTETPASATSTIDDAKLEAATEKIANEESELSFKSSLQVLGGFMLLFNSYGTIEIWD